MKLLLLLVGVVVLVVGATLGALSATQGSSTPTASFPPSGPYKGSGVPGGIRVPDATLPSYRGGTVSLRALRGKVLVVTFLDSKCTTKCPILAALIAHTWPLLTSGDRRQVRVYAISMNPLSDTRASVRTFLAARRALTAIDWLVGPVKEMRPVWRDFAVLPAIDTGSDDVHSASVRIYDRRGIWVSDLSAGVELTPANLVHDIRLALHARPS